MKITGDDYGTFVNNYVAYTNAEKGMEVEIGRRPALNSFSGLKGCKVLDFGCGPGTNGNELRQAGAIQVTGIDISAEELKRAREVDPESCYLQYDGIHLEEALNGSKVDAILCSYSLCTIRSEVLTPILRDMRKVLVDGGELVIIDPNLQTAFGVRYPGELRYHGRRHGVVQNGDSVKVTLGEGENAVLLKKDIYRDHNEYRQLLSEAGFTIEIFEEVMPSKECEERWAKQARKYPPFLHIKAH